MKFRQLMIELLYTRYGMYVYGMYVISSEKMQRQTQIKTCLYATESSFFQLL
jgi:hypothetical protein